MIDEKILKKLPPGFAQQLPKLTEADLKRIIQESARAIKEIRKELTSHPEINNFKEQIKEIEQPYKDVIAIQDARIAACHETLNGRGCAISLTDGKEEAKKAS